MSPALQAQIDLLAASDAENPLCLERALGGAAGVQLATLSEALASVDLDLVATLPPALQDILNTALNSTSTNPLCLERELGGAAGVQLAILAAIMASGGGGGDVLNPGVAYIQTNGNDSTAQLGNPAKPFLTGTAAWQSVRDYHNDPTKQHVFMFGQGAWEIEMSPAEVENEYVLAIFGIGAWGTEVNLVNEAANNGTNGGPGSIGVAPGGAGVGGDSGGNGDDLTIDLTIQSNLSASITMSFVAGNGGGGGAGGPGAEGDNETAGGNGGEGGNGGDGGSVLGQVLLVSAYFTFNSLGGLGGGGGEGGTFGGGSFGSGNTGGNGSTGSDGSVTVYVTPYLSILYNCGAVLPGNYGDNTFQP